MATKTKAEAGMKARTRSIAKTLLEELHQSTSKDELVAQITAKVHGEFANRAENYIEEMISAYAEESLKEIAKSKGISAALLNTKQEQLFGEHMLDAIIYQDGEVVKLRDANHDQVSLQMNAIIDDKIKKDRAFIRNMEFLRPVIGVMQSSGVSAADALAILRSRSQ